MTADDLFGRDTAFRQSTSANTNLCSPHSFMNGAGDCIRRGVYSILRDVGCRVRLEWRFGEVRDDGIGWVGLYVFLLLGGDDVERMRWSCRYCATGWTGG